MKKKLLFVAVAALVLASCSSDETVAVKQDSPINFRPLNNGRTRAADISSAADLKSFNVFAKQSSGSSDYIGSGANAVTFTGPGTYNSVSKYYWPSSGNLDFYAWSASSDANGNKETNITVTDYANYTVTVPPTAKEQPDFIYASSMNVEKVVPVPLAFSHYESRIVLKVKNTASNLKFEVKGWKIVYPDKDGKITFSNFSSSTRDASWSDNTDISVDNEFKSDLSTSANIDANTTAAGQLGTDAEQMIMIPQEIVGDTPSDLAYTGVETDQKLNRAYIAIKYIATNTTTNEAGAEGYRCWPLPSSSKWEAGKQYTYVIDLADGGYKEFADGTDTDPDPEFEGSLIQFATITVNPWITDLNDDGEDNDDIGVEM